MEPKSSARTSSRSVVSEFNPPAENLSLWETVWCPNLNSIQQRLRCLHTFGHVVQPVATWHVSMVSSLSLSLCRLSDARSLRWLDDSIQIRFYFAAGSLLFSRCYMLHEISLLADRESATLSETSSVFLDVRFAFTQELIPDLYLSQISVSLRSSGASPVWI